VQPNRWERLLEQKPIALVDHLIDEVARLFSKALVEWPPSVESLDEVSAAPLRELLLRQPARPDERLYRQAFTLARYDVGRDLEAFDDHVRNERWVAVGLLPSDRPLLLFLARLLTEQVLTLAEHTSGRLTRPQLLEVLRRTETHFFRKVPS
jgi:hypothetical protein